MLPINQILNTDCRTGLSQLPDGSVDCIVTSPPYFGLRDYGHGDQIGLEQTPEEYVDNLLQVFTECRRVLKPEGTLWLNLGDSYAGNGGQYGSEKSTLQGRQPGEVEFGMEKRKVKGGDGLKPKDLIGIPWMVAFALRQPQYTGKIKNESDRVWLAAMIDGEGCFYVHRRKAGQHAGDGYYRKNDTYSVAIEVANTNLSIIERCYELTGVGSVICQEKSRRRPLYRWTVRCDEAKQIAEEVYPYIVAKRQQCRILYNLPNNGDKATAGWEAMKLLHAGIPTDFDFPDIKAKLTNLGWYLRQDLVWSKPNPMPESVTDRCTKAHEYIFLLSKSRQYYYDHKAIMVDAKNPEDDIRRMMQQSADNKSMPDEKRNGLRPKSWNGSSFDTGKTGEMKMTRGGLSKSGNKERKDRPGAPEGTGKHQQGSVPWEGAKANKRSVWSVTTKPFSEAHFATFPEDLIIDCIKAGCPEGGVVLDPFMGAGTTAVVARKLNRNFIGFELNPEYLKIAEKRLRNQIGLFL